MVDWSTGEYAPWTSPPLFDLLPDLSADEKQRLRLQGFSPEHEDGIPRFPPGPSHPVPCGGLGDASIIPTVRHALHHYTWYVHFIRAVGPHLFHGTWYDSCCVGGEFEAVKPLMEDGVHFRDEVWSHVNFWARSVSLWRTHPKRPKFGSQIRELNKASGAHYKPPTCSDPSPLAPCIATVETCTIIEEPLTQYRSSCAFCGGYLDILHPSDFVCGNGNKEDWNVQEWFGMLFICRKGETFPFSQE